MLLFDSTRWNQGTRAIAPLIGFDSDIEFLEKQTDKSPVSLMRPLGDRRVRVRMEVVGRLWGTLELSETARLLNISTTGVLLESPLPFALQSTETLRLLVEGEEVAVDAHVRHLRQVIREGAPPNYLIGLEFVSPPSSLIDSIEASFGDDDERPHTK